MYPDRLFGTGFLVLRNGIPFASAQTGTWRRAWGGRSESGRGLERTFEDAGSLAVVVLGARVRWVDDCAMLPLEALLEGCGALRNFEEIQETSCCTLWAPAAPSLAVLLSMSRAYV